jgi:hypothetical protein
MDGWRFFLRAVNLQGFISAFFSDENERGSKCPTGCLLGEYRIWARADTFLGFWCLNGSLMRLKLKLSVQTRSTVRIQLTKYLKF